MLAQISSAELHGVMDNTTMVYIETQEKTRANQTLVSFCTKKDRTKFFIKVSSKIQNIYNIPKL